MKFSDKGIKSVRLIVLFSANTRENIRRLRFWSYGMSMFYCRYYSWSLFVHCFIPAAVSSKSIWGAWYPCSMSCGLGTRTRVRQCEDPLSCPQPHQEFESCNEKSCVGKIIHQCRILYDVDLIAYLVLEVKWLSEWLNLGMLKYFIIFYYSLH